MSREVARRIAHANEGRVPELLAFKYAALRESVFRFFRGTCRLFYEDWPRKSALNDAPLAWITGDLHLENFGIYKGDDRRIYFDLNDFDEAALAPCTWELARVLTSIHLAADGLLSKAEGASALAAQFLDVYADALAAGKAGWQVRGTVDGPVGDLMEVADLRKRADFLDRRTQRAGSKRKILVDGVHALALKAGERRQIMAVMREFAGKQSQPRWFEPLDAAWRIAGTGSLGLRRSVILVEGKGSPDGNYLLDLKQAQPADLLLARLKLRQPRWKSEAQRIVSVQQRMQAVSPAFLSALEFGGASYVLKELQPREDRLDLATLGRSGLEQAIAAMARSTAWSQLRSGGRDGSAYADQWIRFAGKRKWKQALLAYARDYSLVVRNDWEEFRQSSLDDPARPR